MHPSSINNMKKAMGFLNLSSKLKILDVGGRDLKQDRSYYSLYQEYADCYHIADIVPGEMVTHLMPELYKIPSEDNFYDLIVSGQTLEHVKNPFRLVNEMKRICKLNGYFIFIAPSTGPRHDVIDCWRFMDDGFKAIAEECDLEVIADWIDYSSTDKKSRNWHDHVFVGKKINSKTLS